MLRTFEEKQDFTVFKFDAALDLEKHIKSPIALHTSAPISELPSKLSTMLRSDPDPNFITWSDLNKV